MRTEACESVLSVLRFVLTERNGGTLVEAPPLPVGKLATRRDIAVVMMPGRMGLCVGVDEGEREE